MARTSAQVFGWIAGGGVTLGVLSTMPPLLTTAPPKAFVAGLALATLGAILLRVRTPPR